MNRIKTGWITLLLLGITALVAHADASKLDPRARVALQRVRNGGTTIESMRASGAALNASGHLDVFIQGSVSRTDLEAMGVYVRTAVRGIYTAYIPADAVERVAAHPGVTAIRGSAPVEPEYISEISASAPFETAHDSSIVTTGATTWRGAGPAFTGINGAGVLVGDVDSGVDFDHGDFKDGSGLTRLVSIWDQTVATGPAPLPYGYGTECTQAMINGGLCPQVDVSGHGTHVLGTAGGDGSQTGGAVPAHTYAGMAPMADLLMVKTNFQTTGVFDGVAYFFDVATARGQNGVCNLSLGSHFGSHDGTSAFEAGLSALTGPGRVIVKSAGNERGVAQHAEAFAAGAGTDVTMSISSSGTVGRAIAIDGYYESTENLSVRVTTPNGTVIGPIPLGGVNGVYPGTSAGTNGVVYVENGLALSGGGDPEVYIELNQTAAGQNFAGTWTFTFIPVVLGPANGEVDLWRFFVNLGTANFVLGNQATEELVSEPGNAVELITTASWVTRRTWVACNGTITTFTGTPAAGPLSSFSSPGPTRDGRQKPDIAAPGQAILSTRSFDITIVCPAGASTLANDAGNHIANLGTSMAAPHVTGATAMLMQRFGALSPADVKAYLTANARIDGFTGAPWNKDWGNGKLNLGSLLPEVTVLSPNGGETLQLCTKAVLTWTADGDAKPIVDVDLRLSRSGPGGPFEDIALDVPNTGSYSWIVTGPATANAYFQVTVTDSGGNVVSDISNAAFSILPQTSTTTLTSDIAKTLCGGKVNFTATVSPSSATGTVNFFDGGAAIGSVPLMGGTANLSISTLSAGPHTITAVYKGDSCFAASTDSLEHQVNPVPTTTLLESEPNPSGCGQDVVFVATIDPPPGNGVVNFFNNGNKPLGSAAVSGGTAQITISTLAIGTHSITAVFKGIECYAASTSNKVVQEVVQNATAVFLTSDMNPSSCGVKVTLRAEVGEPQPPGLAFASSGRVFLAPPPPTGTVNFFDNGNPIGSAPLVDSVATLSVTNFTVGTHSITAVYKGDTCYATSTSDKLVQEVVPFQTTLQLTSDPNPSTCGQKVFVRAVVDPPAATGTVSFYDNLNPIGTAPVVNGVAELSISTLGAGLHSLTAEFSGDSCYSSSLSNKVTHLVVPSPTTITLATSPNPSSCGEKVTATATVSPATATGQVNFFDGGAPIGSAALVNGVATLSITTLAVGTHVLTAQYKGDSCFAASQSNPVTQEVQGATTTTTLTGDPNPSVCREKVTLTVRVDPPTATGQVNLSGDASGSATLVNGVATFSVVLGAGSHSFTANYKGDGCFAPSQSAKLVQVVTQAPSTTTLTSSPNPSRCDQKVTLTARVEPPTATGTVNFFDSLAAIGSAPIVNGTATLSITTLADGVHSFTATYKGDSCYAPSTSDKVEHSHDCPVATLLSLFLAEPRGNSIELRWQFGDPSLFVETRLERAGSVQGPWVAVATDVRDESGVLLAVDRSVEAGRSYWYRLVARPEVGAPLVFGPLTATAGSTIRAYELAGIWPNPSKSFTRVDFAIPRESDIRLSIVDVQGREVAVLAEGMHRPGRYQAVWSGETARGLAPVGMYFVRYQVPGKVITGRLVLAR